MDEYERLKQIQKINDYFESKKKIVMYNPHRIKRTRSKDNGQWTNDEKRIYNKQYYEANKEIMKKKQKEYYEKKKALKPMNYTYY